MRVRSLGREDPLEEEMATHSSYSGLENTYGQRSLVGYSPKGCCKELDITERLSTEQRCSICRQNFQLCQKYNPSSHLIETPVETDLAAI